MIAEVLASMIAMSPPRVVTEAPMEAERIAGGVRVEVGDVVLELTTAEAERIGELAKTR